jgi:hypothetical protein
MTDNSDNAALDINTLDALAAKIRNALRDVQTATRNALRAALEAGDALIAAEERVSEGRWLAWLKDNCFLSKRTAQLYMQLARHRDEIETEIALAPELSLRAARKLISKSNNDSSVSGDDDDGNEPPDPEPTELERAVAWWQSASPDERKEFFKIIGLPAVRAALPPAWLPELENFVLGNVAMRASPKEQAALRNLRMRRSSMLERTAQRIPA